MINMIMASEMDKSGSGQDPKTVWYEHCDEISVFVKAGTNSCPPQFSPTD